MPETNENERHDDLRAELDRLKRDLADANREAAALRKERDSAQKDRDGLASERDELKSNLRNVNHEMTDRRHDLRRREQEWETERAKLQADLDEIANGYVALEAERDEWRQKYEAEPSELQAKLDELTGKLRDRDHRAAFEKVAKAHGITDPARVADLYTLTGYRPDSDSVDEVKLGEVIGAAVKVRPWLADVPSPAGAEGGEKSGTTSAVEPSSNATTSSSVARATTNQGSPGANGQGAGSGAVTTGKGQPVATGKPGPGADRGESLSVEKQTTVDPMTRFGRPVGQGAF